MDGRQIGVAVMVRRRDAIERSLNDLWAKKPLYSKLEDALTYQKHSEICGCWEEDHVRDWVITIRLTEGEVQKLMGLVNEKG